MMYVVLYTTTYYIYMRIIYKNGRMTLSVPYSKEYA